MIFIFNRQKISFAENWAGGEVFGWNCVILPQKFASSANISTLEVVEVCKFELKSVHQILQITQQRNRSKYPPLKSSTAAENSHMTKLTLSWLLGTTQR